MEKLRLDLEALEVERLDIAVIDLNRGLELFGMGHAATELNQSCTSACNRSELGCTDYCACDQAQCGASCMEPENSGPNDPFADGSS